MNKLTLSQICYVYDLALRVNSASHDEKRAKHLLNVSVFGKSAKELVIAIRQLASAMIGLIDSSENAWRADLAANTLSIRHDDSQAIITHESARRMWLKIEDELGD